MKIPNREEARRLLFEGETLNPGAWVAHSLHTAEAAECIAKNCSGMDSEIAYSLGCIHDIGRRYGFSYIKHIFDGYAFLNELNYPDAARISLTHSFPDKNIGSYVGERDCSQEDLSFLKNYLDQTEFTLYDKLIQLCDHLALPAGYCLIEQRLVDVTLRYGFNEFTLEKWRTIFNLKQEFEMLIGRSVYDCLNC